MDDRPLDPGRLNDRIGFIAVLGAIVWAFTQQALQLQRRENDRRLLDLNNEAKRIDDAVAKNVSADTWDAFTNTYALSLRDRNEKFEQIGSFQNKLLGAFALASIFIPVVTGIIVAVVVYLLTRHAVPVVKTTP